MTPPTAVVRTRIVNDVVNGSGQEAAFSSALGDADVAGDAMVDDRRTHSSQRQDRAEWVAVGAAVAQRRDQSLLALGENHALAIMSDTDLNLPPRGAVFAALGTSGQPCTSGSWKAHMRCQTVTVNWGRTHRSREASNLAGP